jgi:hypothetical protein
MFTPVLTIIDLVNYLLQDNKKLAGTYVILMVVCMFFAGLSSFSTA